MKLTIQKNRLVEALRLLQAAAPAAGALPICGGVKIEADADAPVTMRATNLDVYASLEVEADGVSGFGRACVPAKRLGAVAARLPDGAVELWTDDANMVHVRGGDARYRLGGLLPGEFPKEPKCRAGWRGVKLAAADFAVLLGRAARCMSTDDTRKVLMGALLEADLVDGAESLRAVATDGRGLACATCAVETNIGGLEALVPARSVDALARLVGEGKDVQLRIDGSGRLFADCGPVRASVGLNAAAYPHWEGVVPVTAGRTAVAVDSSALLAAVSRVSLVCDDPYSAVTLVLSGDALKVKGGAEQGGGEFAEDALPVEYEGTDTTMVFSAGLLADQLRSAGAGAQLVFSEGTAGAEPLVIRSPGYMGVLMPLRK